MMLEGKASVEPRDTVLIVYITADDVRSKLALSIEECVLWSDVSDVREGLPIEVSSVNDSVWSDEPSNVDPLLPMDVKRTELTWPSDSVV